MRCSTEELQKIKDNWNTQLERNHSVPLAFRTLANLSVRWSRAEERTVERDGLRGDEARVALVERARRVPEAKHVPLLDLKCGI